MIDRWTTAHTVGRRQPMFKGAHLAHALSSSRSALATIISTLAAAAVLGRAACRQVASGCCRATSRATKCSRVRLLRMKGELVSRGAEERLESKRRQLRNHLSTCCQSAAALENSHLARLERTSLSLSSASS